ncbi:MAG: CCA tRNA nucleotidyltransferase [Planctomycetota bacterium]
MSALLRKKAERIVQELSDAGHEALFAGGCVRDMLRGEEPHDYDVATDATPDEVQGLFERTVPVGRQFGVVLVLLGDDQFEVATFRAEAGYSDGRHPDDVVFADARADALRRDFTINGLFYDPLAETLIDYVGGEADIEAGVVRAIGDPAERFAEDALRMMRAVRFTARFGYRLEPATRTALEARAADIAKVSGERLREELGRILTGPNRGDALELLRTTGLLRVVLPEVEAMAGCEQPDEFHPEGDVFTHTCLCLDELREPSVPLAVGTLLHDVGKPLTRREADRVRFNQHDKVGAQVARDICRRLRFSSADTAHIVDLVAKHMRFMAVREMRESRLKRLLRNPYIDDHLELHRVDCVASHGDLGNYDFCRQKKEGLKDEEIRPPRLLTGDDLIDMGYAPGPLFSEILERVEDAQLEGEVESKDEATALVHREFPRLRDTRAR